MRSGREGVHVQHNADAGVADFADARASAYRAAGFMALRVQANKGGDLLVLGQARSSQRHVCVVSSGEDALAAAILRLDGQFGRYGYRRITSLLRQTGWRVNYKQVTLVADMR
ncbi:transposase [Azospirillum sp. 412522]|nr:transposase [Azospirillum sp. 412522]